MSTLLDASTLHIELTSRCVLKCPRCPRTELNLDYLNQEIDLDLFQRTFPIDTLGLIRRVIFCGHTGDPIYANSLVPVIQYIRTNSNIQISITTNGSYRKKDFWIDLGSQLGTNDTVTFSVDGWDHDSNNLYRENSDFSSIIDGIATLRQHSKCRIHWSMIYFRFNQNHVDQIRDLAKSLGCDFFQCVRSSKFGGRYDVNGIDSLEPDRDFTASSALYEKDLEGFTGRGPLVYTLKSVNKHDWARCANHLKEPFLDVRGYLLPCAWFTGDYQSNAWLEKNKHRLDIHHRSFTEILEDHDLWNDLAETWDSNPMPICKIKCKHAQQ